MPYTNKEDRKPFEGVLDQLPPINGVGNLTFIITYILKKYWVNNSRRYQNIAEILGALSCAELDFWEHVAKPYEDKKENENGGVW